MWCEITNLEGFPRVKEKKVTINLISQINISLNPKLHFHPACCPDFFQGDDDTVFEDYKNVSPEKNNDNITK